jgi:hypothetical protein
MTQSPDACMRESAFRVFAGSCMLVMDLQTNAVLRVLKGGLEGIDVRFGFSILSYNQGR